MKTLRLIDPRLFWALAIGAAYFAARALGVELPGGDALGLGSGLALLGTALVTLRAGGLPDLGIESDRPGIGRRTRLTVRAREDGRGLGALRVELVRGERRALLAERSHTPRPAWAPWAPRTTEDTLEVEVGRDVQPELEPEIQSRSQSRSSLL